jgi:uncharacterized tellurite resistance protein B-like protein
VTSEEKPAETPVDTPAKPKREMPERLKKHSLANKPKDVLKAMASKGGQTVTPKKIEAAKLGALKRAAAAGYLPKEKVDWLVQRLESRELMAADIQNYIDEIRQNVHPSQRIALVNAMNQTAKLVHGEKVKVEGQHVHAHVVLGEEERQALLARLSGDMNGPR